MEILILKSAACLAILMVFYKLFLERLAIHKFKRFYLLGALVVSIVIPFITFIKYVEPTFDFGSQEMYSDIPPYFPADTNVIESELSNYILIILWSIYGLGVLLFASKFCINLFGIVSKINKNEKQKHSNFISVLLNDLIVPHTFFSYIFLNKTKFEAKAIPKEVLLHEQTHASQKHSLDILFIELLQIAFWFNPLLYFIKKDIKLNHEFLADDAVLKQGIDSSTYQETLLQFASNANGIPLAHAINYSLIKKRFTIMKTQTSKKAVWLRSLLLIPLLGGLLFSFSSTKEVEKELVPNLNTKDNLETETHDISDYINPYFPLTTEKEKADFKNLVNNEVKRNNIPVLELKQNPLNLKLNGKQTSLETLKEDFIKSTNDKKSNLRIEAKGAVDFDFIKKIMAVISKDYLLKIKLSEQAYIEDKTDYLNKSENDNSKSQKEATPEQVAEYNKLAKYYNAEIKGNAIIKLKDIKRIKELYNLMSDAQKKNAEPFPNFPPPPPPPPPAPPKVKKAEASNIPPPPPPPAPPTKEDILNGVSGFSNYMLQMENNGDVIFYDNKKITANEAISIYKKYGKIDILTKRIERGKYQVHLSKAKGEVTSLNSEDLTNIPPPPPPISTIDHVVLMAKEEAQFYYNGEVISSDKAIDIVKNNKEINISSHSNNGKSTVHLSTKPIKVVNGKASFSEDKKRLYNDRQKALESRKDAREKMQEKRNEATKNMKEQRKEMLIKRKAELEERKKMIKERTYSPRKPLAEQFKGMENNGGEFFFEGNKISENEAIKLIKKNPKLNVSMQNINGKSTVHLSTKGIKVVNGKLEN